MGDFLRHLLLLPMGVQKAVSAEQRSSRLPAPLARYRPEYPFPVCVPAELESVFPGTDESTTFQRLLPNHGTQERMPSKIHRPVPRSKDRNRTSPLPLKSKQNLFGQSTLSERNSGQRSTARYVGCSPEAFHWHLVCKSLAMQNPRGLLPQAFNRHCFSLC